jgi:hypothetical protein
MTRTRPALYAVALLAAPAVNTGPDRGPCSRVGCGYGEKTDHVHGYEGWKTYCGTCGKASCPSYRPPGKRKCARCGVPENVHASLHDPQMRGIPAGVCPWWVRPAPWPLRAANTALARALSWLRA